MSIVTAGNAINITLTSAADEIGFGLIGARGELPSPQRLLDHLEDGLVELRLLRRSPTCEVRVKPGRRKTGANHRYDDGGSTRSC